MPYIKQEQRETNNIVVKDDAITNPGELNFAITKILDQYIARHGKSYTTLNAIVGVLECAKLELYRRIAAPYEDKKVEENGDVYTCL